jgi:hypothetical protein
MAKGTSAVIIMINKALFKGTDFLESIFALGRIFKDQSIVNNS